MLRSAVSSPSRLLCARALATSAPTVASSLPATPSKLRVDSPDKLGNGGRSSVSGLTATVFGSTGFLGRYVVNRFGKVGTMLVIPYRGDEHDYRHLKVMGDLGRIAFHFCPTTDYGRVVKMVEDSDIVVNLIGRDYETSNFSYEKTHVTLAANVAKACKQTGVARLVHVSALNAAADSPSRFLQTKAAGEAAVREHFPEATIIRPAKMFGHEDRLINRIAFMHFNPLFMGDPVLNGGNTIFRPVYVGDVAQAVYKASTSLDLIGKTLELAGPKEYTYSELLDLFGETTRRVIRPMDLPAAAVELVVRALELLPPSPAICREDVTRLMIDEVFSSPDAKGFEAVGITPTSLADTALVFMRRYRSATYFDQPAGEDSEFTVVGNEVVRGPPPSTAANY